MSHSQNREPYIDFLAKFKASSDVDLLIHASSSYRLLSLLKSDANGTFID